MQPYKPVFKLVKQLLRVYDACLCTRVLLLVLLHYHPKVRLCRPKNLHRGGIAGGSEKCAFVKDELGFDDCLDHKQNDLKGRLKDACAKGIDVYFENVGGKVFEAVLPRLNDFARVPICGMIANYNATSRDELQSDVYMFELMRNMLVKRMHFEGFIVSDHWAEQMPKFQRDMAKWNEQKPFTYREDITEGLENAPATFNGLLKGGNFGKTIIKVA